MIPSHFNKHLSKVGIEKVKISVEWSSQRPDYRRLLRQGLEEDLRQLSMLGGLTWSQTDTDEILNLDHPPVLASYVLSISHCPLAGGYAYAAARPGLKQIGFDLESLKRVTHQAIARMAQPQEIQIAPNPALLWCAKEAAFKALIGHKQPQVLSQIKIHNWVDVDLHNWEFAFEFQGLELISGRGLAGASADLALSVAAI